MSEPVTSRIRRPSWRDPRLGVGVLLVAGSVALGSWTMARADHTVTVFTAATVLAPGEVLAEEDLVATQVSVPDVAQTYLTPTGLAEGQVVLRTVGEGEMVPLAAIGAAETVQVRTVTVPLDAALAEVVRAGSRVDLWVAEPAPETGGQELLPPEPLVQGVEIAQVHQDSSVFAGADEMVAQVLVATEDLAAVLAAQTGGGAITIVPVPG
ncbi:MAG TPA: hypothetical protein H9815_10880 [Candidatus Ruania gallistercoris]|uniref:SAF domain-containing protein n=1 Tax=Candidatus Ruania gallistercoris TaxID=2838746 RepID=A0A9D2EFB9_9MICO|nr:hypothetical protein [Candidatus Ruania gallistercoris]